MQQLSVFNIPKEEDDGFIYDDEGKFIRIDIKKFSRWWEKEQELSKIQSENTDKILLRAKETIEETNKLIRAALYK